LAYTPDDLLIEYLEDGYEAGSKYLTQLDWEDPDEGFSPTGNSEIDEIERRLDMGEDPEVVLAGWGDGGKAQTMVPSAPSPDAKDDEDIDDSYLSPSEAQDSNGPLVWKPR